MICFFFISDVLILGVPLLNRVMKEWFYFIFEKKGIFLILTKSVENNFQLGRTRPPPVPLDNLSALLSSKGAILLKRRALFQEQVSSIFYFN